MKKIGFIVTFMLSICTCLIDFILLFYLLASGGIHEVDIIIIISMIFGPLVILKLVYDIYSKNFKYSLLKRPDEAKVKVYTIFILLTIFLNLLSLSLTFIFHV